MVSTEAWVTLGGQDSQLESSESPSTESLAGWLQLSNLQAL